MAVQHRNDDTGDLQEAAEEEEDDEILKLEEEVEKMAQNILEFRSSFMRQLGSTLSNLKASHGPVLPTHLVDEGDPKTLMLPGPDSEVGVSQGLMKETLVLPALDSSVEAEELQQKISSNTSALAAVLNRMKECKTRIDKLDANNGIIHPVFKRKRTN